MRTAAMPAIQKASRNRALPRLESCSRPRWVPDCIFARSNPQYFRN
ncbi:hypothetical protein BP1258A_1317 [Burkholderia pseudomallei 1258a]|uniref:Uncharacterized protein n=1 Tax=Burkholderia pseudomallei (strain 1026b) TaxID=884204 RepID=A0A0H3HMX0_BURP2|nr:hypothetical protein BP1026B_I1643 [Burkholderia pseudomallei 1026b]EIF65953.1 hypothetical protein BP1258A_1317 [Burkholderia pseudomallei 1258a]EIF66445.1 hypothetical protein BP1026A_0775 [Burkholderia pseudomallei 1026a]EIF67975.1 hypothetical protein BP1258B_1410 [Burkholderia pseudomallei 1258b]EIF76958.1 hypothetical protein BP354E_1195 [Burkholderia pseudomallei 354e]EIF81220.1 hypothetical protein BP354A_1571 [Burkholderia pseudomallei 354a]